MIKETWDDKYDVKTVSAKLNKLDFVKFKTHCDAKGIPPSKETQNLIEHEIKNPIAQNIAGKSVFRYNPAKDNFGWQAILDKGVISYIEDDLSFEFLNQLKDAIDNAMDERNTFTQKNKDDSVSIPSKILRKGL